MPTFLKGQEQIDSGWRYRIIPEVLSQDIRFRFYRVVAGLSSHSLLSHSSPFAVRTHIRIEDVTYIPRLGQIGKH